MVKTALLWVGLLALGGCGTLKNVDRNSDVRLSESEAILVLGVNPRYRVHLVHGSVTDDVWRRPFNDVPEANLFPEDGYIVVKLKVQPAGERWAVPSVMPEGIGGGLYVPCNDSMVPTFTLHGGTVNYVGGIDYQLTGKRLTFSVSSDEKAAREFIASHYPRFAALHVSTLTPLKVKTTVCDPKVITVPIYLPAPRR